MIYLDNSATTAQAPEVTEAMCEFMRSVYGNPSSLHAEGRRAMHALRDARRCVASYLGVKEEEIYFTSGGTEADNIAVLGAANIKKGSRAVTSAIEHPAVLRAMDFLEERGFEVIRVMPEADGTVDARKVIDAVNENTCLVSVMHVNNETGSVNDIAEIAAAAKKKAPRALVHTDAVQSFGHIETKPYDLKVDMMSISGHKIHAPKGTGVLFVKKGVNDLKSTLFGGGQEKGLRSGTENTFGIWGLKRAVELIDLNDGNKAAALRKRLKDGLLSFDKTQYNGGENCSPYILNVSFVGVRSEVMLNALDERGICVSSASACAKGRAVSHVLKAMGAKHADNAVRFSLSRYTTEAEIDETIDAVGEILKLFRR